MLTTIILLMALGYIFGIVSPAPMAICFGLYLIIRLFQWFEGAHSSIRHAELIDSGEVVYPDNVDQSTT